MRFDIRCLHMNLRKAGLAMFAGGLAFWFAYTIHAGNSSKVMTIDKEFATRINQNNIRATIIDLQAQGTRSSFDGQAATSRYLQKALLAIGLRPEVQKYEYAGRVWENVMVTFKGQEKPDQSILAIAHYDSIGKVGSLHAPGADDNASGVAVLLELARVLPQKPLLSTVQLVFFSNEEKGKKGSKAFARLARENKQNILAVLNIDGVGYTPRSKGFITEAADLLTSSSPVIRKGKMLVHFTGSHIQKFMHSDTLLKVVSRRQDSYLINGYANGNTCPERTDCLVTNDS